MTLYEITTGSVGMSYVRAYAWAATEEEVRRLFAEKNPGQRIADVERLFDADAPPFCTVVSSDGWETTL